MTNLRAQNLSELKEKLEARELTAQAIIDDCLEGIEEINPKINAFVTNTTYAPPREILEAASAPRLRGIPVALKDIILTKGVATTCSSRILQGFIPPYDATVTSRLHIEGGVVLGKTNMDEFAMGSSNETSAQGPVRNPWDLERVSGGSSGGSAAAVAARLVPAALGTDTGGSVRQPAAFCGVVGLKPTYGRVSRYGVIAFASSLDQVGVMARTVKDCALVAECIAGHDTFDATSARRPVPPWSQSLDQGVGGLRIGVPREYLGDGLDPEIRASFDAAIAELEQRGAKIVDISLPHTELAIATYYIIAPAEASSNLAKFDGVRYGYRAKGAESLSEMYRLTRSQGFGREVKRRILIGTYVLSQGYFDQYYLKAQQVRSKIWQDFEQAFAEKCDLIATPSTPTPAFKLNEKLDDPLAMYLNDIFTVTANLAGLPALSVPCGFSKAGLPIGLQLIGRAWDEGTILNAAATYEGINRWHAKAPPISGTA